MFLDQCDMLLLDLDGVVLLGDHPLPSAVSSLHHLRHMGKLLRFLTNDPRPSREQVVDRLGAMGIEATPHEIVTSGWATAAFLAQRQIHSVYLLGSAGLATELLRRGIRVVEQGNPEAVVVGCDEQITYQHLKRAATLIAEGAQFIATNADGGFSTPDGPSPATGAFVKALEAASGKRPLVIGKPSPTIFTSAIDGLASHLRVVMIGDNPSTDILGAHQLGITAVLVAPDAPHFSSHLDFRAPDAVIANLSSLFDAQFAPRRWERPTFVWPERVEAGIAAVVFDQSGKVLLGKRTDNGLWGLPSGHVEPGETAEEAVIREIREETGLHVKVTRLIGLYSDPASQIFSYPRGEVVQFITSCFECTIMGGDLHADGSEVLDVAFVNVQTLPPDLLPMHPCWLSDALAPTSGAFIR
jgi:HAD superfamily hydrolase (TIGR01450 family)